MAYIGKAPPITTNLLEDADQDTKIQVEESADEDTIRFDIAGAEVATLTNSSLVLKGTTPTLTIGDAGAEDTKIVFDGNAQDYHIGLDDSADDLVIGLGSALGTTTHMAFDETGAVIKPLQPAAIVRQSSNVNNVTGNNTNYTAVFDTEIADQNSDFASNTFTAPVGGIYLLIGHIWLYSITTSATTFSPSIVTSNRTYNYLQYWVEGSNTRSQEAASFSVLADMDASDTAVVKILVNGEGSDVVEYAAGSHFMATLIC